MKRTIGLALVYCLSSQVYAGAITNAVIVAGKAAASAQKIKTPGAVYSHKEIGGIVHRIQDSLYVSDKIPVSIARADSKIKIESHGKTSFIDIKALGGEVLDFRITSRSNTDVRVALKVLDNNGKLEEITYFIKPGEMVKATEKVHLSAAKELVQFRVAEVVSSPSTSSRTLRASGVK